MIKLKKSLAVISIVIILLITFYTPIGAIRRSLFFSNPIQSLICNVKKSKYVDDFYGQQYLIKGFRPWDGSSEIKFAYVKRNMLGVCYWSGGGSGP